MSLRHLLYVSDATRPLTRDDLDRLVEVSRRRNARKHITGVLFYSCGHFVQLLEGESADVHELMGVIRQDPRHNHVRVLRDRPAERRLFEKWEMGLLDLELHGEDDRRKLRRLIDLAGTGDKDAHGTPMELVLLSEFCMLLPAPA